MQVCCGEHKCEVRGCSWIFGIYKDDVCTFRFSLNFIPMLNFGEVNNTKGLSSLPFTSDSLASFSPLQLTKIAFVLFVSADLNNKLSIANRYLYRLHLAKKLFALLSLIAMSTGFNL